MTLMKLAVAGLAAALIVSPAAYAKGQSWWLDLEAGAEYDDNVAVNQNIDSADASSGTGDIAGTFEVDAGYKPVDTDSSRVEVSYDFYQSVYRDVSAFNYTEHSPSLNAWTKLDGVKLGLTYTYMNSLLDNHFFQEQHILQPSVSAYLTDQIYVSVFYRYLDKNYDQLDNRRDAKTQQPGGDVFYYWDKPNRGYVSAGLSYTIEDADLQTNYPSYGYDGLSARAAVQFPLSFFEHTGRLRFSYAYQNRDYDDINSTPIPPVTIPPTPHLKREDERNTVRAKLEVDISEDFKAIGEYRFVDRSSNLATADYQENIGSLSFRYSFY